MQLGQHNCSNWARDSQTDFRNESLQPRMKQRWLDRIRMMEYDMIWYDMIWSYMVTYDHIIISMHINKYPGISINISMDVKSIYIYIQIISMNINKYRWISINNHHLELLNYCSIMSLPWFGHNLWWPKHGKRWFFPWLLCLRSTKPSGKWSQSLNHEELRPFFRADLK